MGGVGKTRLAVGAAAEVRRAFTDGVWLVELANLNDEGRRRAVGRGSAWTPGAGDGLVADALCDRLAERRLLFVLDNCEHVLDACAVLANTLLERCPDLRILTTSQQPLRTRAQPA